MAYKRLETDELDDDVLNKFNKVITINDDTPLLCSNVHTNLNLLVLFIQELHLL